MKPSYPALAIVLASGLAQAQSDSSYEDALKLPDTLITANRERQTRNDSSTASSVFTRADIERLQPSSVAELLQRVPGVQVAQNGGRGSISELFIRGTKTAQSLVLVDGQRISSASQGSSPLELLSVDQIERIEILRGPRSAIYGADAIGGVIQIFTRRASGEGLHPRLHLGYGSQRSWERSAGLSGANQNTRFSLNLSSEDTRGISRTHIHQGADHDRDAYRNTAFSFNLQHRFSERLEAGFSLLDQRGESEYDMGWDGRYPYTDFQLSSYSGFLSGTVNDRWQSRLELGHTENRNVERFDDSPVSNPFNTYRDSAAWLNTLDLGDGHSLLLGADWNEDRLHSNTLYQENSRWNRALFIQHSFRGERFATELGLRHDKNEQFGSENTFNGALTLFVDPANDLILSYAEGFRAPTFNELYWPQDPWGGGGNLLLEPETSRTYELQWRSQLAANTRLEAALYRTELKNAISGWPAQNVDRARINGFETALHHSIQGWNGSIGLSLIDPRDRSSGHTLNHRARRTLNLDLDRTIGRFSIGASWLAVSHSYDDLANQRDMSGYGLLGLRASWQASDALRLAVKVDNLLDKRYSRALYDHDWDGQYDPYREPGRTTLFSVTWTPGQ